MSGFDVKKIGIIIDKNLFNNNDGNNINGPCLIKVPDFVKQPLGKYYLYFAHHSGKYIRMAYSDDVVGPYKLYEGGVLHVTNTPGYDHVASPDVVIETDNKKLTMYYHCPFNNGLTEQSTFFAHSTDGLNFISENTNILYPYFRHFICKNDEYGIAMYYHESSIILKKVNNVFETKQQILKKSRHVAIFETDNKHYILYTIVGDCPEHILITEILDINQATLSNPTTLIFPELEYEHSNIAPTKSKYGKENKKVNQLRDPYVYTEDTKIYVLYTICGEQGIAISLITKK